MSEKSIRPLSPHLQVYRPQWTSIYSILHRITGVALGLGALLIAFWIISLGTSAEIFSIVHNLLSSVLGILLLAGFCWALLFHLLNGIRHLFWDAGKGLDLENGRKSGHLVSMGSLLLSAIIVVIGIL